MRKNNSRVVPGVKFNMLTVLEHLGYQGGMKVWKCKVWKREYCSHIELDCWACKELRLSDDGKNPDANDEAQSCKERAGLANL
jgi:hypothetical protein